MRRRLQFRDIGRWRRRRRAEQVLEHPLAALHHRGPIGIRGHRQHAALPQQPAAISGGQRDATELRAVNPRDAVVLGEPLVDEGVVGGNQFEQAAVFADQARDEELGLGEERPAERLVEREDDRIRLHGFDVSQLQPLTRKVRHEGVGARIVEHPADLALEHRWIRQPSSLRHLEQLGVGNGAPQEERQARGELDVADAIRLAALDPGILLDAEQELRRDEHRFDGGLDAALKVRRLARAFA